MAANLIGMLNAGMFGHATEPGEHVDWSAPDYRTAGQWLDTLGQDVATYAADNPHMIVFEAPAPEWREATADELSAHLSGEALWNDAGGVFDVRETEHGLEVLEGPALECGCIPHATTMRGMWGFYCDTEDQGYCNFECPHDCDED